MIITMSVDSSKMPYPRFRARVHTMLSELHLRGNKVSLVFAGPDEKVDNITRAKTGIWKAKVEINGPATSDELQNLKAQILDAPLEPEARF